MTEKSLRVSGIEISEDAVVITYMDEPRMSDGGLPVTRATTMQVFRADEPTAPLVEDFVTSANDFAQDLLRATDDSHTRSLEEYEEAVDDDELGLGMGDPHSA